MTRDRDGHPVIDEEHIADMLPDDDDYATGEPEAEEQKVDPEQIAQEEQKEHEDDSASSKSPSDDMFEDPTLEAEGEEEPDENQEENKAADDAGDDKKGEETPDANAEFERLGLNRQFKDINDLLQRVPDMNRYVTSLEQQRAQMIRDFATLNEVRRTSKEEPSAPATFDMDKFEGDPMGHLKELGFVSREEAMSMAQATAAESVERRQVEDFLDPSKNSRITELWPVMDRIFNERPWMKRMPRGEMLEACFDMARNEVDSKQPPVKPKATQVAQVDPDKKARAKTSGGTRAPVERDPEKITLDYFIKNSPRAIEERFGYGD